MKRIKNLYKAGMIGMIAVGLTMGASAQRRDGGGGRGNGGGGERPQGHMEQPRQQQQPRMEQPRQSAPMGGERHAITRPDRNQNFPQQTRPETPRNNPPVVQQNPRHDQQQPRQNFPTQQQPANPRHVDPPIVRNNNNGSRDYHPNNNRPDNNFHPVNNNRAGRDYGNSRRVYTEHERAWGYSYNHYNRRPVVVNRFYYGGGYHPHPYYYRSFIAPRWGIHINILPVGYYSFYHGPNRFYYYDGLFYQPYNDYYETVEPPLGAYIPGIPAAAAPVIINGQNYYEYNGTYYQRVYDNTQPYEVVGVNGLLQNDLAPATPDDADMSLDGGDVISDQSISPATPEALSVLPENFKTVTLNNITYYVSPSGEYYTKNIDENGKVTYTVAAIENGG